MIWKSKAGSVLCFLGIATMLFATCGIFSPPVTPVGPDPFVHEPLTSPENVFYELDYAMNQKDIELYEDLLDDTYLFLSPSQIDTLRCEFAKAEDVTLTGRAFEYFDIVRYEVMETGAHWIEYGVNVAPEDAKDPSYEHPDENWEVFQIPVDMDLLDYTETDGFYIDANFEFKMRKQFDPDTGEPILDPETKEQIWKIVRWEEYTGG